MSDLESLERRMDAIERKLDDLIFQRSGTEPGLEPERRPRTRGSRGRIFVGVLLMLLGVIWLGKNLGIEWLQNVEFWAFALIGAGVFMIIGERRR